MNLQNTSQFDKDLLKTLKLLFHSPPKPPEPYSPFTQYKTAGQVDQKKGETLLQEGKAGCLVFAGGQGTRLGHDGPKGTFFIRKKSLFQILVEKVLAASERAKHPLPLAIMTSPENDTETRAFFQKHKNFDLHPSQLFFFCQKTLPFLNQNGELFFKGSNTRATGPDGNGHALKLFAEEGIAKMWADQGITLVHTVLIDNPLAEPFPCDLLSHHIATNADISLICMERADPKEKVGVIVQRKGHPEVVEYTEMEAKEFEAKDLNTKKFKHPLANLSLLCFSMNFIQKVAAKTVLPLHKVLKTCPTLDNPYPQKPNAWKFERFIFDLLPHAKKISPLAFPREDCFAPLKDKKSVAAVEKALRG